MGRRAVGGTKGDGDVHLNPVTYNFRRFLFLSTESNDISREPSLWGGVCVWCVQFIFTQLENSVLSEQDNYLMCLFTIWRKVRPGSPQVLGKACSLVLAYRDARYVRSLPKAAQDLVWGTLN